MSSPLRNLIQVAGIIDADEAHMLLAAGVDWFGFPLRLAHHLEDLSEVEAAAIIKRTLPADRCVLITYLTKPDEIIDLCKQLGVSRVQLHNEMTVEQIAQVRSSAPDLFIMKSLVITGENFEELRHLVSRSAPLVDAFITDTFDPVSGAIGATGRTHDWRVSQRLVSSSPKPIILAGGLTPGNVAEAIEGVRPAGVDAHTGLEGRDGRKTNIKVHDFVSAARKAFASLPRK